MKQFSTIIGLAQEKVELVLRSDDEYVPVKVVSVACQINKSHGDPDVNHSSITECLKGTTVRLPKPHQNKPEPENAERRVPPNPLETRSTVGPMYDQKSLKLLNFGVNTITLLVIGYFLGGIVLGPLVSLQGCVGVSFSPAMATPCAGSVLGLVLAAFGNLAYTYYYFTRKL